MDADAYAPCDTPVGPALVAFNDRGVCAVECGDDAAGFEARLTARRGRPPRRVPALPEGLRRALDRCLAGEIDAVEVDLDGVSPFQREVLAATSTIPAGEVRSYAWVAERLGRPLAVRAVGSALARNPVPLVIPCHRVVRSDGKVGDYALGGSQAKRRLLAGEGVAVDDGGVPAAV